MRALAQIRGEIIAAKQRVPEDVLKELAVDSLEDAWNALKGIAQYGENDEVRLRACETILAYAVGRPLVRAETSSTIKTQAPSVDMAELTSEELQAVKVLMEGQRKRRGE